MSKLVADNLRALTDAVETPMKYPVRGSARMTSNVNGQTTTVVRVSFNLSSITDIGTGMTDYSLTAAMSSTDYCQQMTGDGSGAWEAGSNRTVQASASVVRGVTWANGAAADCLQAMVAIFGTLA